MKEKKTLYTLITGASQGIGKALAEECAKQQMNLYLVALPNSGLAEYSSRLSKNYSVKTRFYESDLNLPDAYLKVFEYAVNQEIWVNTLINNAGIGFNGHFADMTAGDIESMIMLNVRATTMLTYIFLDHLKQIKHSRILNMGSMAAWLPLPGKCIYAASKAYVLFFSKALQSELKGTGISVTAVLPYGVLTNNMVKERINKSGKLAHLTVMTPEKVAKISIEGLMKNRKIIIPGKFGRAIFYTGWLIPQGLVIKMMEKEFEKTF
jgi:uncharacterized protein